MSKQKVNAITPTREEDFPEWYQQVIKAADLAENSPVRGCMVIKPWGYGLWENIQKQLDARIKETGHQNAYFPLFIPLSFLEKEAAHVEGFAKECAVVTHHRLELIDGKLVPTGELEEPLIVRPTSETIIGASFSKWVSSYRDLPLLINQWANVVRWEMRPRMFLRTAEFLWQEGHTAHVDEADAMRETLLMLEVYRELLEDKLAIPVIPGEKTEGERFPGAVRTFTVEAMMQDGKALQAGTSHYLGQNFAKASEIKFLNQHGEHEFAHTTSWGVSTRMIGGLIMTHSDDDGLRLPPRVAPKQIVIIPVVPKPELQDSVFAFVDALSEKLSKVNFHGERLGVVVDKREGRGGEKNWNWIKKGIPIRVEVGPRDIESNSVMVCRRDKDAKDKTSMGVDAFVESAHTILDEIQSNYFNQALSFQKEKTTEGLASYEDLVSHFSGEKSGFVRAHWAGGKTEEEKLAALKLTIRCLPIAQSGKEGTCLLSGKKTSVEAILAKAY